MSRTSCGVRQVAVVGGVVVLTLLPAAAVSSQAPTLRLGIGQSAEIRAALHFGCRACSVTAAAVTQLKTRGPSSGLMWDTAVGGAESRPPVPRPLCSGVARAGLVRVSARTVRYVLICNQWWCCAGGEQPCSAVREHLGYLQRDGEHFRSPHHQQQPSHAADTGAGGGHGHWTLDTLISL